MLTCNVTVNEREYELSFYQISGYGYPKMAPMKKVPRNVKEEVITATQKFLKKHLVRLEK
jgi:hypothetical protein